MSSRAYGSVRRSHHEIAERNLLLNTLLPLTVFEAESMLIKTIVKGYVLYWTDRSPGLCHRAYPWLSRPQSGKERAAMTELPTKLDASFRLGSEFSRNLFIISIVIVILLPAYNAVFIYPSFTKLFLDTETKDATSIAKYFMSMFLSRYSELTKNAFDDEILKEISTLREGLGLAKLKVFSRSGEIVFSTDSEEIGSINNEQYFQEIVAQGGVYTKFVKKNTDSLEHQKMLVDVVETYMPLMKDGGFVGAFEIYYDITDKKQNLERLLLISFVIVIILASAVLITSTVNIVKERRMLIERRRAEGERERLIVELQDALAEVRILSGLLPICSACKKIRDDQGYWNKIEDYLSSHSQVTFTHGICPECAKKLYPDYYKGK